MRGQCQHLTHLTKWPHTLAPPPPHTHTPHTPHTHLPQFCSKHRLSLSSEVDPAVAMHSAHGSHTSQNSHRATCGGTQLDEVWTVGPPPLDEAERLLSLQMALKISDLRSVTLPLSVASVWWVLRRGESRVPLNPGHWNPKP